MTVRLTGIFSWRLTPSRQRTAFGSSSAPEGRGAATSPMPAAAPSGEAARSMTQPRSASMDWKISSRMRSRS